MNNKYAICFSLYDINKLSDTNLYYYKGIVDALCVKNRQFDIYIDTTEYCKHVLYKIIQQEKLNCDNVFYTLHPDNEYGSFWRHITMFKKCPYYDLIGVENSQNFSLYNYYDDFIINDNYSVYCKSNFNRLVNHSCYGINQNYSDDTLYICYKNFISNYNKILDICNNIEIKKYKIVEFDRLVLSSLLINETLNNRNAYFLYYINDTYVDYINEINNCINPQYHTYNLSKFIKLSEYYNIEDNTYTLNDCKLLYDIVKPELKNNIQHINSTHQNLCMNIQRYMLDYLKKFDIKDYYE